MKHLIKCYIEVLMKIQEMNDYDVFIQDLKQNLNQQMWNSTRAYCKSI